jgi:hypothetical protein
LTTKAKIRRVNFCEQKWVNSRERQSWRDDPVQEWHKNWAHALTIAGFP